MSDSGHYMPLYVYHHYLQVVSTLVGHMASGHVWCHTMRAMAMRVLCVLVLSCGDSNATRVASSLIPPMFVIS